MAVGNSLNFPTFVKAKTPEQLTQAMMQNNLVHHKELNYFSIQFVKGEWYAWFFLDHSSQLRNDKRVK